MLNKPLSKLPTDTIELCNYSFDMQPNLNMMHMREGAKDLIWVQILVL